MAAEAQKKNSHHHSHHHHHHHHHKKVLHLKSVERIIHLPVVESAHMYYEKIKNSNSLLKWSLLPAETGVWLAVGTALPVVTYFQRPVSAVDTIICHGLDVINKGNIMLQNSNSLLKWSLLPAETGVWLAVGTALPVVTYFQRPVSAVDTIICHGLDVIEANIPAVTYPPELVFNITKDYVNAKVVTPVLKRADSVKQLSLSGATICGEMAANGLNNAIDVADKYVEKYLPDISDVTDSGSDNPSSAGNSDSKTVQTIQHVNQFSRKLQRRITRRTIAEAKALKQQSADTIRCLVYLVDLLARDPKAFMEKAKEVWGELSKDEPENQVPPANLEQLIAMLTREMARRMVHLANYSSARLVVLSHHSLHTVQVGAINAVWWADYFIKTLHMESALDMAATQISKMHRLALETIEKLFDLIKRLKQEGAKSSGNAVTALPSPHHPPQALPQPSLPPPSSPAPVTPHINATPNSPTPPEKPVASQKNGEPQHNYDSN